MAASASSSVPPTLEPVFVGGTVAQHILFVVALCRFQHHTLRLSSIHYVTWSIVHIALHAIAFALAGSMGPLVLGIAVTAWALRMDIGIGALFGALEIGYALAAMSLVPLLGLSIGATVAIAFAAIVGAIVAEATSHVLIQGYPPRPPAYVRRVTTPRQAGLFVPYFVVTFGLFFMTLDLVMRLGYRPRLHQRANELASDWHRDALAAAPSPDSPERRLHTRAVADLA